MQSIELDRSLCHCEQQSDEAIQLLAFVVQALDCFAALAMTEEARPPRSSPLGGVEAGIRGFDQ
jgi:hypothetical protein